MVKRMIQIALIKKIYDRFSNQKLRRTMGAVLMASAVALPMAACESEREYETPTGQVEIEREGSEIEIERENDLGASLNEMGRDMRTGASQVGEGVREGTTEMREGVREGATEMREDLREAGRMVPDVDVNVQTREGDSSRR